MIGEKSTLPELIWFFGLPSEEYTKREKGEKEQKRIEEEEKKKKSEEEDKKKTAEQEEKKRLKEARCIAFPRLP